MTARRQWAIVAVVVVALAGGLMAATRWLGPEARPVGPGAPAPPFAAATVPPAPAGRRSLADYRGQVLLVNVWATWCVPCRNEMPSIQALHDALGPKGLKVVAVSTDAAGTEQEIRAFADELKLTFEVLHDPEGKIELDYRTTGVPETFVIGRDGVIRKRVIGATDWNSTGNRALLEQLLAEPAGP